jgi:hypothetical protein
MSTANFMRVKEKEIAALRQSINILNHKIESLYAVGMTDLGNNLHEVAQTLEATITSLNDAIDQYLGNSLKKIPDGKWNKIEKSIIKQAQEAVERQKVLNASKQFYEKHIKPLDNADNARNTE